MARLREQLPEGLDQLNRIMTGQVLRNDKLILDSIKLMLQYSQPLPKQQVEHSGTVGCMVLDPYAEPPPVVEVKVEPVPVAALPPRVRKKAKVFPPAPSGGHETAAPTPEAA